MFSVLGLTIYLSFSYENSIYYVIFLLAIILLSRGRKLTRTVVVINAIASVLFLVQSFFLDHLSFSTVSDTDTLTLALLVLLGLSFILFWFLSKEKAMDDRGHRVNRSRLLAGQILYSASILLLIFFDHVSPNNLIIYASVILAILLYYIGSKLVTAFQ